MLALRQAGRYSNSDISSSASSRDRAVLPVVFMVVVVVHAVVLVAA